MMAHPNKRKGDGFERAIREHARERGFDADRTRAGYARDHGDVHLATGPAGPRAILQCKHEARIDLAGYVRDTEEQRLAAGAEVGAAVVKRRGVGDVGQSYVVMTLNAWLDLARRAGYAIEDGPADDDPGWITCGSCSRTIPLSTQGYPYPHDCQERTQD